MYRILLFTLLAGLLPLVAVCQNYRVHHYTPFSSMSAQQQYSVQKTEFGLAYPSMTITARNHFVAKGSTSIADIDTNFTLAKRSGFGIGFLSAGVRDLATMRDGRSILALEIALSINAYTWRFDKIEAVGFNGRNSANFTNYGLPLTFMYKHGAEAELSREAKYMYSFGVGARPAYSTTNYFGQGQNKFRFSPLIMAECGVFAGRAIKLRATWYPLTEKLYDGSFKIDKTNTMTASAKGSGNLVISFIYIPYSNRWS